MPAFVEKYTAEQREAMAAAYVDRKIRPARAVVQLAAEGKLTLHGEPLEPFETNENAVRDFARKLRKKRAGEVVSDLATKPPRDAIEALRRRLVNVADAMLRDVELQKPGEVEPERLRQIMRCVLEASKLPGPTDPRPAQGQARDADGKRGPQTTGGVGGALLRDHRSGQASAPVREAENDEGPAEAGPDPAAFVADAIAAL